MTLCGGEGVSNDMQVQTVINRRWLPLNALRAYEAVGRNLSFTVGAQALHVSQSALSRHVISLEELLGKPLLERRPSGLVLTEAGAALLPVVAKAFDRIEQTLNLIQQGERSARTLRVHMPPSLLHHMALPILRDFRREFPDIRIDVSSSHVTGLPSHDLDVAVVYDRPSVDDRVTDLLWMVRVTPMCSPELAAREAGKSLGEFLAGNELLHVKLDNQPRDFLWTTFARQCGLNLDTDRGLAFDTNMSAVQYATGGDGVVLADVDMLAHEVAAGRMTAPFPNAVFDEGYGYYLKFHPEDLGDPVISLFRSWMIGRFGAHVAEAQAEP